MTPITAVIPAKNCLDLTLRCIHALATYAGDLCRVFYADDGSDGYVTDAIRHFSRDAGIELDFLPRRGNGGFTRAINDGIKSSDNHVLVLNNDCFVSEGSIQALLKVITDNDEHVAAVSPFAKNDFDRGSTIERRREVPFFCTLLNRKAITAVGLLKECPEFESGLGPDFEWCWRADNAGWQILLCRSIEVEHLGSQSFKRLGRDRESLLKTALDKLKEYK